jgi:hypothetical protein
VFKRDFCGLQERLDDFRFIPISGSNPEIQVHTCWPPEGNCFDVFGACHGLVECWFFIIQRRALRVAVVTLKQRHAGSGRRGCLKICVECLTSDVGAIRELHPLANLHFAR